MAVARLADGQHGAVQDVQHCKQRCGAMALVVVSNAFGIAPEKDLTQAFSIAIRIQHAEFGIQFKTSLLCSSCQHTKALAIQGRSQEPNECQGQTGFQSIAKKNARKILDVVLFRVIPAAGEQPCGYRPARDARTNADAPFSAVPIFLRPAPGFGTVIALRCNS